MILVYIFIVLWCFVLLITATDGDWRFMLGIAAAVALFIVFVAFSAPTHTIAIHSL